MPDIEGKRGFKYLPLETTLCSDDSFAIEIEESDPAFGTVERLAQGRRSSDPTVRNPESVLSLEEQQRLARERWQKIKNEPLKPLYYPHLRFSKDDCK